MLELYKENSRFQPRFILPIILLQYFQPRTSVALRSTFFPFGCEESWELSALFPRVTDSAPPKLKFSLLHVGLFFPTLHIYEKINVSFFLEAAKQDRIGVLGGIQPTLANL